PPAPVSALVTLTTDFGLDDAYVAAMKAAMLAVEPDLRLLDVSHAIEAQDVLGAAFLLRQVAPLTPPGTVHLVVVDPGVGTDRQALAARCGDHLFVGSDNGLVSLIWDQDGQVDVVVLGRRAYWHSPAPTATLHGRDAFRPVAAHLASGRSLTEVGTPTARYQRLHWAHPIAV